MPFVLYLIAIVVVVICGTGHRATPPSIKKNLPYYDDSMERE